MQWWCRASGCPTISCSHAACIQYTTVHCTYPISCCCSLGGVPEDLPMRSASASAHSAATETRPGREEDKTREWHPQPPSADFFLCFWNGSMNTTQSGRLNAGARCQRGRYGALTLGSCMDGADPIPCQFRFASQISQLLVLAVARPVPSCVVESRDAEMQ